MITYTAAYYHLPEDGWYWCQVLDFPGVLSQGRTLDKARRMLCDALQLMSEGRIEEGKPLPTPDPAAKDDSASVVEPIRLYLKAKAGAAP